ncbi:pleiotropic regulatory protein [Candidatus Omnitrophus magneticus]|uniref:Pleiotropic regulatory protein n=1 Tax=Candidatus Omnitrophus magneticus TaxID=1609969 RepID=A0A0F0CWW2_9BACT|nr:pleiotropic regulatory protein [Candidatus Omnitrophus magneticus]
MSENTPQVLIPFVDINTPHSVLAEELKATFNTIMNSGGFIGGQFLDDFEADFARFCNVKHCIGVANGTDAIQLAVMTAGVNKGDVVITVPNTFIATAEAISLAGAVPDFVDVNEQTNNISIEKLTNYIEDHCQWDDATATLIHKKTGRAVTAIIPVHLYGQMADMDPIMELGKKYNLKIIEDACQAHGAQYLSKNGGQEKWLTAGSCGISGAFSFYPSKNLGAFGDAGAMVTNDEKISKAVKILRNHGQTTRNVHDVEGYNSRLDAIQAALLQIKLRYLSMWNEKRIQNAKRYNALLNAINEIKVPEYPIWTKCVYHLYVIRTSKRNELQAYLRSKGVSAEIHYPTPIHLQKAYSWLGYGEGAFPIAEKLAKEILSLPMYPDLTVEHQERVTDLIKDFFGVVG